VNLTSLYIVGIGCDHVYMILDFRYYMHLVEHTVRVAPRPTRLINLILADRPVDNSV
jgi:hypothetical protein